MMNRSRGHSLVSGIDVINNNRILITQPTQNMVVEMNGEGRTLWQVNLPGVATATRLPTGHILAASQANNSVTEVDRMGKFVWEYKEGFSPYRARRR
jgi:hypothetical protein